MTSSYKLSCINKRVPASQAYPIFYIKANHIALIALSRFAEAQTITGDFPPNSNAVFFRFVYELACITFLPVKVDPVNDIDLTLLLLVKASPALGP